MALFSTSQNAVILLCILLTVSCIDAFLFLYFQMFHSRLQNNSTSQLTNKNILWMIGKVSSMFFFYSCRPRKSVQCSTDPEFGLSNVPQKCVKTMENLNVHYPQRIIFQLRNILKVWNSIMLVGTFVRKQKNLHILLTGYEKHFTRVRVRVLFVLDDLNQSKPSLRLFSSDAFFLRTYTYGVLSTPKLVH